MTYECASTMGRALWLKSRSQTDWTTMLTKSRDKSQDVGSDHRVCTC